MHKIYSLSILCLCYIVTITNWHSQREREAVNKWTSWIIYITNQPVEGKCIQPSELSEWGTALHSCATKLVNFHGPQPMPKKSAMWNPWVNFHPQCTQWKSYCDKVMGEFSPTVYTMKVLLCSVHGWILTYCVHSVSDPFIK